MLDFSRLATELQNKIESVFQFPAKHLIIDFRASKPEGSQGGVVLFEFYSQVLKGSN